MGCQFCNCKQQVYVLKTESQLLNVCCCFVNGDCSLLGKAFAEEKRQALFYLGGIQEVFGVLGEKHSKASVCLLLVSKLKHS